MEIRDVICGIHHIPITIFVDEDGNASANSCEKCLREQYDAGYQDGRESHIADGD